MESRDALLKFVLGCQVASPPLPLLSMLLRFSAAYN